MVMTADSSEQIVAAFPDGGYWTAPKPNPFLEELDREFKRKRRAKWYNRGDMSSAADAYVAQDLDELATTGQFIPSQKAI